MTILNSKEIS